MGMGFLLTMCLRLPVGRHLDIVSQREMLVRHSLACVGVLTVRGSCRSGCQKPSKVDKMVFEQAHLFKNYVDLHVEIQ